MYISVLFTSPIKTFFVNAFLNVPQGIASPQPAADIAVLLTAPTCTCLEATTQTSRKLAGQKMKTTLFLENFGGFILPQPLGSRSGQKATCPLSWHRCQVWTEALLSQLHVIHIVTLSYLESSTFL